MAGSTNPSLIGEDCAATIKFGSVTAGVVTWLSSAFGISGKCKRISAEDSAELTNTKGMGDARKLHRGHSGSTRIDVERMVGFGGYGFTQSRVSPIGLACQIQILEYSGLSTPQVFTGIVEKWKADLQETEATIESLSIMCDIDASYS